MKNTLNNNSIEKSIAKAYIVLLPLRMFSVFSEFMGIFGAAASYFDFFLHLLGMSLLLICRRGKIRSTKLGNSFAASIGILLTISVAMALCLHNSLGTLDGENSFTAIIGPSIYYVQYILIILYNINIFRMFTVEEIDKLMGITAKWLLALGYIQVLICIGIGGIGSIYDGLNIMGAFQPAEYIQELERIPLAGSEPAAGGWMIGLFVVPYLLSKIITSQQKKGYVVQSLAWLPIIYFTKSSTCYILVTAAILVFSVLYYRYTNARKRGAFVLAGTVVLLIGVTLVFVGSFGDNEIAQRIRYLLFEKLFDGDNESTVTRTIPTYINLQIFLRYPLFGVGNGNQGFFYREFFPSWGEISSNTYEKIVGVADGGVFVPSLFSGFGIVGVIVFLIYAFRLVKLAVCQRENLGSMYYMFMIAAVVFIVNGFQGDYFGQYLPLFIMSIPFMGTCCRKENKLVS